MNANTVYFSSAYELSSQICGMLLEAFGNLNSLWTQGWLCPQPKLHTAVFLVSFYHLLEGQLTLYL